MGRIVLVTGANGFVGRWVTASLKQDAALTVVTTDLQKCAVALDDHSPCADVYLPGDLSNPEFVKVLQSVKRFDVIIHLAGILAKDDGAQTHATIMDANVSGLARILEVAREHESRFIFPSTGLIYGDRKAPYTEEMHPMPSDFYSLSKYLGETMISYFAKKYGFPAVIFRPSILYGPGQGGSMFIPSLVKALLAGREFPMTPGEQTRDFLYITDFVEAVRHAMNTQDMEGIYNVGSGQAHTLRFVADLAASIIGAPDLLRIGALVYRERESWEYCLDITRIIGKTGWRPRVDLRTGLEAVIGHGLGEMGGT